MMEAMEDRKMRPASWTCPTANGMELKATKHVAWTAEERRTSRTREGRYGAKASCRKMMVAKEIEAGKQMEELIKPKDMPLTQSTRRLPFCLLVVVAEEDENLALFPSPSLSVGGGVCDGRVL